MKLHFNGILRVVSQFAAFLAFVLSPPSAQAQMVPGVEAMLALPQPGELDLRDAFLELCGESLRISRMEPRGFDDWVQIAESQYRDTAVMANQLPGYWARYDQGELIALYAYTSACFRSINPLLRGRNAEQKIRYNALIRAINHILTQLPEYHGLVRRVVVDLPPPLLARHQPQRFVIDPAYVSTTRDEHNSFGGCIEFRIQSHHGRSVEILSAHPGEHEVLFSPGTAFRITNRVDKPANRYCSHPVELDMEEVDLIEASSPLIYPVISDLPRRQRWFQPDVLPQL